MTFQELQTEFFARGFDYLNDGGAGVVRAKKWLNQAYQEICAMEDWPTLEASASVSNGATITDLGEIESVTDTSNTATLWPEDRRDLVDRYTDLTVSGQAMFYYVTAGTTLNVFPVSSATFSVKYWKIPADMSANGDTPSLPAALHYAIVDYAVARAYRDKENEAAAQSAQAQGDRLVELVREREMFKSHQAPSHIMVYGYSSDD